MSSLQISLLVIGALIVLAVYIFNVVQERRVRRRIEAQFTKHEDILLSGADKRRAGRVEPTLGTTGETGGETADESESMAVGGGAGGRDGAIPAAGESPTPAPADQATGGPAVRAFGADTQPDFDTEFVVVLRLPAPGPAPEIDPGASGNFDKRVRWFVREGPNDPWRPAGERRAMPVGEIAGCLMLADRDGPVTKAQLQSFLRVASDAAVSLQAASEAPDLDDCVERAKALDRICAELDVQIGISLFKQDRAGTPVPIAGTRLRGVVEAAGFRLSGGGQFEYASEDDDRALFTLHNLRNEPFTAESMRSLQTPGLTLLLDVPRTADAVRAYDLMRAVAKRLATTLEAALVDDNRRPLPEASLGAIRSQVQQVVAAMRAAHIEPGSPRALRLFD